MRTLTAGILIVDDDTLVLNAMKRMLERAGVTNVLTCSDSRRVFDVLSDRNVSVVTLDVSMPFVSGVEVLTGIRGRHPDISVIMVTASRDVEIAVECMKRGAEDYLVKPFERNRLLATVRRAMERRELAQEVRLLRSQVLSQDLDRPEAFSHIITVSDRMRSIFKYVTAIAPGSRPALITGESGVGKELLAKAVHEVSDRSGRFVAVNVAGLDEAMFSDALFGHVPGAFTGAEKERPGLIHRAARGTLFLDEIGDLDVSAQVKLLRLLEEREFYPLGSDVPKSSDTRIVAATNTDLASRQEDGRFRKDLFYRLTAHHVHIPPLRERVEDLHGLVDHFVAEAAAQLSRTEPPIPADLVPILSAYAFPGNIRELQSMIFEWMTIGDVDSIAADTDAALSKGFQEADSSFFRRYIAEHASSGSPAAGSPTAEPPDRTIQQFSHRGRLPTIKEAEDYLIQQSLKLSRGNQSVAARMLGISQSKISRWAALHSRAEQGYSS